MKYFSYLLMMCLVLMGCSDSSLESNDTAPYRIQREGQTMTATRQLGEYELRLSVQQFGDHDFTFKPGIRYRGQDANHEIFHSKQLFDIDLQMDGKTLLPSRSSTSEELATELKKDSWYSEEVEIILTPEQVQYISNGEADLILNAGFRSEQSGYNDEKKMIISGEDILFKQVDADQKE
ncbi:hypothetical protein [Paenibacillus sp. FSL K6-2393]|uniref:hypothetical protein n=1 Tax=Paenibacillus sp. FSL K6-2393 TaxID=2921475 RepID=UPI0030F6EAB2